MTPLNFVCIVQASVRGLNHFISHSENHKNYLLDWSFCIIILTNYANVKTIKEKLFRLIINISNQQGYWNHLSRIWCLDFTTFYILLFSSELAHFFQSCSFAIPNDCFSVHLLSTYLHNISIYVWVMTYDLWYYGWVISSLSKVLDVSYCMHRQ